MGIRLTQITLVAGALLLILGLAFAPRLSQENRQKADTDPVNLQISNAVAKVENGKKPMEGIMMLREILKKDSTNVDVHWHLAQFSITSRQIENAAYRFEQVIKYDDNQKYPEAYFWLAQAKVALNKNNEAAKLFNKYLNLETDTVIRKGVKRMLK
jgi:TolA-binding protein